MNEASAPFRPLGGDGRRRRALVVRLLVAVATTAVLGLAVPASAPASCVGPQLTVEGSVPTTPEAAGSSTAGARAGAVAPSTSGVVTEVVRGTRIVVQGLMFHDGCADSVEVGGCSGPRVTDPESPARDVDLVLVRGDRRWSLGSADADGPEAQYAVRWQVLVPRDVPLGPAVLVARGAQAEVDVRR
jgi:hypothetical protein